MTAVGLLQAIAATLDTAGVPFMLTGSMASTYHGAGRATMDIDLVIDPTRTQLLAVVASVTEAGLYAEADAALEALDRQTMFNVVDFSTGWKVDLIIRKSRPFSQAEFERRIPIEYDGRRLCVATVEDVIVAKLEWAQLGGSARQIEDVAALLKLHAGQLDVAYLDRWITELGLAAQLQQAELTRGTM